MAKTIVSWVLFGIFSYIWWWFGYDWSYLQSDRADWTSVYMLFTLVSIILMRKAATGA